jgi:hypothetical protein
MFKHKKKPFNFPNQPNKGGVEEWLKTVGTRHDELMDLNSRVPHNCYTCWWLQFKEGSSNRVCTKPGKLNMKVEAAGVGTCYDYRVDPNALNRAQGISAYVS